MENLKRFSRYLSVFTPGQCQDYPLQVTVVS